MNQGPVVGDADHGDGRDETTNERLDRNWEEILQEMRVVQTGTQILTGFLLTVAFQPRLATLTPAQRGLYLGLVVAAVLTTALGLAPVNLHRVLFRRHAKAAVVLAGNLVLRAMLAGVTLVLAGTVLLVFDVVAGRTIALVATGLVLAVIVVLAALPL